MTREASSFLALPADFAARLFGHAETVVLARNLGRMEESLAIVPLAKLDPSVVDMLTLVLVGAAATRRIADTGWIYTPRGYAAKHS